MVSLNITIKAFITPVGSAAARRADLIGATQAECIFQTTTAFADSFGSPTSNASRFQRALQQLEGVASDVLIGTGEPHLDSRLAAASGAAHLLLFPLTPTSSWPPSPAANWKPMGQKSTASSVRTSSATRWRRCGLKANAPRKIPELFELNLLRQAKAKRAHIVLPEGDDDRILEAAHQLLADDVCELTILGDPEDIEKRAAENGWEIAAANLANPTEGDQLEQFAQDFFELRKHKGISIDDARATMQDISYYATMMVHKGLADGMVSGAAHTTAHTIKPSFQIIKTAPGSSVVSSIFLLVMDGVLCSLAIAP